MHNYKLILSFTTMQYDYAAQKDKYELLLSSIGSLIEGENDLIANMANLSPLLHQEFGFWWTGFYRIQGEELVLGPLACTRIAFGKGGGGSAWKIRHSIVVPNVEKFPGHIACSSESRSEIVVPVWQNQQIIAVLDIDSKDLDTFDETDLRYLEKAVSLLTQ